MTALEGRTYAIAGAGGALGPHVARALVAAGASVALADRSTEHVKHLVDELPADRVHADAVDLLDPRGAESWAAAVALRFGGVEQVDTVDVHPLARQPDHDRREVLRRAVRERDVGPLR